MHSFLSFIRRLASFRPSYSHVTSRLAGTSPSLFEALEEAAEYATPRGAASSPAAAVAPSLVPDPLLEPGAVAQLPGVGRLGLGLGLAGVEAEQRRDAVDHVRHAQPARHDVRAVVLDGAQVHAALGLADARRDQLVQQRRHHLARRAPVGRPQREQGRARR